MELCAHACSRSRVSWLCVCTGKQSWRWAHRTAVQRYPGALSTVGLVVFLQQASQGSCFHGTEIIDGTPGRLDLERLFCLYFTPHKRDCTVWRGRLVPKAVWLRYTRFEPAEKLCARIWQPAWNVLKLFHCQQLWTSTYLLGSLSCMLAAFFLECSSSFQIPFFVCSSHLIFALPKAHDTVFLVAASQTWFPNMSSPVSVLFSPFVCMYDFELVRTENFRRAWAPSENELQSTNTEQK